MYSKHEVRVNWGVREHRTCPVMVLWNSKDRHKDAEIEAWGA